MTLEEWLRDYPQSPVGVLALLVLQFRSGERNAAGFVEALQVFDAFLEEWASTVGEDEPDSEMGRNLLQALDGLAEAATQLRHYADNGDEELAEQALNLAVESQELLLDLMNLSEEPGYEL